MARPKAWLLGGDGKIYQLLPCSHSQGAIRVKKSSPKIEDPFTCAAVSKAEAVTIFAKRFIRV